MDKGMKNTKIGSYAERREAIKWMINYYNRDLTEDSRFIKLGIDDLDYLYQMDQNMAVAYNQELLLLDAKFILKIVK